MFNRIEKIIGTPTNGHSGSTCWHTTFDSVWNIEPVYVGNSSYKDTRRFGMICYLESQFLKMKIQVWDDAPEYKTIMNIIQNRDESQYIQFCISNLSPSNLEGSDKYFGGTLSILKFK